MSNEKCKYWSKGHLYMNCCQCENPNSDLCYNLFTDNKFADFHSGKISECKRCGLIVENVKSLSRADNKSHICPNCSYKEATLEFMILSNYKNLSYDELEDRLHLLDGIYDSMVLDELDPYNLIGTHFEKMRKRLENAEDELFD